MDASTLIAPVEKEKKNKKLQVGRGTCVPNKQRKLGHVYTTGTLH